MLVVGCAAASLHPELCRIAKIQPSQPSNPHNQRYMACLSRIKHFHAAIVARCVDLVFGEASFRSEEVATLRSLTHVWQGACDSDILVPTTCPCHGQFPPSHEKYALHRLNAERRASRARRMLRSGVEGGPEPRTRGLVAVHFRPGKQLLGVPHGQVSLQARHRAGDRLRRVSVVSLSFSLAFFFFSPFVLSFTSFISGVGNGGRYRGRGGLSLV